MSVSSGIGDDVGRSPIPSIFETETRAIVNVQRERLGIIPDTLQVSFTELGGQVWKYMGTASRPVLPPLVSTRMQSADLTATEGPWREFYDGLLNALPTLVRQKLEYDRKQAEHDPAYAALNDVLTSTAKTLSRIGIAAQDMTPGSIEERYAALNALLPFFATEATIKEGSTFFDKVRGYLDDVGANYTHSDKISGTIRQAQYELNNLQKELEAWQKPASG